MKYSTKIFALSLCCLSLLGGCSSAKESLGLNKSSPDEFKVLKRAPLALPPSYTLRPPRPGAPRPQEKTTSASAAQTVFGATAPTVKATPTDGSGLLLQQAGANAADPNIRQTIDAQTKELNAVNKTVSQKLLNIGGKDDSASIVDAKKEAERLKHNADAGKPVTDGETPVIEE
jgi:hypothetical protein